MKSDLFNIKKSKSYCKDEKINKFRVKYYKFALVIYWKVIALTTCDVCGKL